MLFEICKNKISGLTKEVESSINHIFFTTKVPEKLEKLFYGQIFIKRGLQSIETCEKFA